LVHPQVAGGSARTRLDEVREAILARVPGARVAKDQAYRSYDLAIDFCEEPPDLGLDTARVIKAIFEEHGARAKISNIHVNGWFGSYDKLSMMQYFARRVWGEDPETLRSAYIFCGDSPNDEAMFAFFPNACAVANIVPFTHDLASLPRFVASREGGDGFVEIVDVILRSRAESRA
jgi:hydroxymethylpyrimidine pyrophosphatase-like HAD family hydrolase